MKTDPTEGASCERLAVLVMAGLPSEMTNSANLTLNILIQLKNNGYAEETITGTGKRLIWIAKHGAARSLKISLTLQELLREYISIKRLNPNDRLFAITPRSYSKLYAYTRDKLADDLHNRTIKTIWLYDFRHYFATTLYQKTRDILYVKQQLGHRDIDNTMIYTQFIDLNEEEYTYRTAKIVDEATALLESGFTYIQDIDGIKIYRKRK